MSEDWLRQAHRERRGQQRAAKDRLRDLSANVSPPAAEVITVAAVEKPATFQRKMRRLIAWLVLIGVVAAVVLPVIGFSYTMFLFTLSVYLYFAFIGLAVILGAALFIWALLTILRS